ncbi:hypothetical protein ALC57_14657 [Trachymyrmex cornetzi]|uniref:Glycoprotein n=1 Tax=Trachymyrmex cornetzi TaxID=471704 RepID=A0A151IXX8_9HYME|nr:hypothetical protein ALC57_14657 [Trachymyrmex cornetzi]
MHSHLSTVKNAQAEYILKITAEQCKKMHLTGIFSFDIHNYIYGLKVNQTTTRPTTFAGSANSDGRCSGAQNSDLYGAWDNVIVQGTTTITLTSYQTSINLETNQIRLKSGTICPYTDATCMDIDGGHTFWKTLPTDHCKFNHYDVLYEGYANRMVDTFFEHPQIVYSLSTQDITFALTRTGEEPVCGYTLIKTEHPKLLILETKKGESFTTKHRLSTENLDIFTYINSKFVYVEKHIRSQMNLLYRDVLKQCCTLEQQVLKGALSLTINSPDEFAYQIMKGPGYMAVISGEVVHIIKCTPVVVKIQHVKECYSELPVQKDNETYFLSPRTHILIKTGTQISCNCVIPPMFFLNDGWYRMTPTPEHSLPPTIMKPMTKPTWHYTNPGSLAASGIYSDKDLENLRDHIMFPAEKGGILNAMARGVKGEPIVSQGISLSHLLDESSIQKITENTWKKIWGNFISFGNASAAIIGIYFYIRTVKLIIDTIIHGYAIHTIYGWSLHLIGALWDSVTNLIIHLSQKPKRKEAFQEEAAEKLTTSEENPNPFKDTNNQERSTEISIE